MGLDLGIVGKACSKIWRWIRDLIGIDFVLLGSLFIIITGTGVILSTRYGDSKIGPALSSGILASAATMLTVLSYRYTVKGNVRDSLNELEHARVDDYIIIPTLYGVKWRPRIISRLLSRHKPQRKKEQGEYWLNTLFQSRTAIKFDVYSESGERHQTDARRFFESYNIDPGAFNDADSIYPDPRLFEIKHKDWDESEYESFYPDLSHDLAALPNLRPDGFHVTIKTTKSREVRDLSTRILRRIEIEALVSSEDQKRSENKVDTVD